MTSFRAAFSVGASGNLARQIQRGAPFELFISADEGYPRRVAEAGLVLRGPQIYATGRLDLLLPEGSPAAGAGPIDTPKKATSQPPARVTHGRQAAAASRALTARFRTAAEKAW